MDKSLSTLLLKYARIFLVLSQNGGPLFAGKPTTNDPTIRTHLNQVPSATKIWSTFSSSAKPISFVHFAFLSHHKGCYTKGADQGVCHDTRNGLPSPLANECPFALAHTPCLQLAATAICGEGRPFVVGVKPKTIFMLAQVSKRMLDRRRNKDQRLVGRNL